MNAFLAMVRLNFKSLLLTTMQLGGHKKKGRAATGVAAFIFISVLMLIMSVSYSFSMGFVFSMMGGMDLLLLIMVIMAIGFPFIFIVFASQSLVFSTKDIDQVLSWPVSAFSVMLARVLALYLEALLLVELLLVPSAAVYASFGGPGGYLAVPLSLIAGLFIALVPTTRALVVGALVSLLISRLGRLKTLLNVIFSMLLVVGIMVLSFSFSYSMSAGAAGEMSLDVDGIRAAILGALPPLGWAVQGMQGNLLMLLATVAVCVAPFLAVTWLFSRFYKSILTHLSSHRIKSDYKLREVSASGSLSALLGKEAGRFFGTPAYLLNAGIGYVMAILAAVVAVFQRSAIQNFIVGISTDLGLPAALVDTYLPALLLGMIAFLCGLSTISASSISLEGKTLWILKEAPLPVGKIFAAKAGFGFLAGGITTVVCTVLVGIAFALTPLDAVGIGLVSLAFTLLSSMVGLMVNLFLPRMDAENDTIIVKQSSSVLITMLVNVVLMVAMVLLFILLNALGAGFVLYCAVATAVMAALCGVLALMLNTVGRRLFAAL
ncbi:hypothetical protein LJC64_04320 [Ruminococcaceae bacterium OttesenSCG-928-A11]|nr:hypothetical protein [Ruminococcaceae bacterium OttesenSCG-928-A11]